MNEHDWEVLTNLHGDLLNYTDDWEVEDEELRELIRKIFDSVDDFKLEREEEQCSALMAKEEEE